MWIFSKMSKYLLLTLMSKFLLGRSFYLFPARLFNSKFCTTASISESKLQEGLFFSKETDPGAVKGTKLRVLKYPHPKLRQENEIVSTFDDNLKSIVKEMFLVMYAAEGIGLAAPQVGINKRLMVFNEMGDAEKPDYEMALVNPVILSQSPVKQLGEEGCLSFPMIYGSVERSEWIEVEYQNIDGQKVVTKFEGRPAVIFQHEYDHLDKILFIDRLVESDRKINQKRLDKYVKKYGPGAAP